MIKSDRWIERMCREKQMIEPFEARQVRQGVISYGVSSYGYDIRIADEFKIFSNVSSSIVDPKKFDASFLVDVQGPSLAFHSDPPSWTAAAEESFAVRSPSRRGL